MTAVVLNIFVIALCVGAVWRGWRQGALRQVPAMFGWCIGIIAARLGGPELARELSAGGLASGYPDGDMAAMWLGITLVYGLTALVVTLICSPLSTLLRVLGHDILASLFGSMLSLLRTVTVLSMLFNVWATFDQDCLALRLADGGDGGLVEGVMHVAPALAGQPDFDEIIVRRQLREAKKISQADAAGPVTADGRGYDQLFV